MFSLKSGGRSARLRAEEDSGPSKLGRSVPAPATMRRFNASISDRRLWESLDSRVSLMVSCFVFFLVGNFYSNNLSNMKRVGKNSLQHSKMTLKYTSTNSTRLELQQKPAIFMETLPWTPTKINQGSASTDSKRADSEAVSKLALRVCDSKS